MNTKPKIYILKARNTKTQTENVVDVYQSLFGAHQGAEDESEHHDITWVIERDRIISVNKDNSMDYRYIIEELEIKP